MFNVHNPHGIKLVTRTQVGLSHLREYTFKYNFPDSIDPFCNCSQRIEKTINFFLPCSTYSSQRKTIFNKISNIKRFLFNQNYSTIVETFLFEFNGLNNEENALITESTMEFFITMERLIAPLL